MKVSSAVNVRSEQAAIESVRPIVDAILKAAFDRATSTGQLSAFENILFVYMGLLKVIQFQAGLLDKNDDLFLWSIERR